MSGARATFHPYLPNGIDGDPLLWIDVPDEGHALAIDLGDLHGVPARWLERVERVVVTHTHMDHFIGFDLLLRRRLGRERELTISGPAGFLERVRGRISGYTWNLIEAYPVPLVIEEIDGATVRAEEYTGASRMQARTLGERPFAGALHGNRAYSIHARSLEHGVPVLGVLLAETERLAVNKNRLLRLGLEPGAWLSELKNAVRRAAAPDTPLDAAAHGGGTRAVTVGEIASEILLRSPGRCIGYLTDLTPSPDNLERAIELVRGVDLLVCEAAFLHEDAALARERNHLTARQAGEIARAAGASRLAPFHVSPRYAGRESEILSEAARAFGGPVLELARGAP
jgi:ribonuclease Z